MYPLTEPIFIPDTYVSGLAQIQELGSAHFRLIFCTNQEVMSGVIERIVTAKLIVSTEGINSAMVMTAKKIGLPIAGEVVRLPRLRY